MSARQDSYYRLLPLQSYQHKHSNIVTLSVWAAHLTQLCSVPCLLSASELRLYTSLSTGHHQMVGVVGRSVSAQLTKSLQAAGQTQRQRAHKEQSTESSMSYITSPAPPQLPVVTSLCSGWLSVQLDSLIFQITVIFDTPLESIWDVTRAEPSNQSNIYQGGCLIVSEEDVYCIFKMLHVCFISCPGGESPFKRLS